MNGEIRLYPSKRHWLVLLPALIAVAYSIFPGVRDGTIATSPHGPQILFFAVGFMVISPIALLNDIYVQLIRKSHITVDSHGIEDEFSKYRFGAIGWNFIDEISVTRQLLGASLTVKFKHDARRPDGTPYPAILSIGTLEISDEQSDAIQNLFASSRNKR